jgi:hypothetical protein
LKDGIGRAPETEEKLDPAAARRFVAEPSALLAHDSEIVRHLARWEPRDLTGAQARHNAASVDDRSVRNNRCDDVTDLF